MPDLLSYKYEVYRKLIHISSSLIAILLWYFGKKDLLIWIIAIAIIFPILDYYRKKITLLKHIYIRLYGNVTRPHEHYSLSGASWVFIGAGITTLLFNEKIAVIAILVMSLSDSAAALIGIKYGKTKFFNKSLEGTLSFFIITYLIIHFFSTASIALTILTVFSSTAIELIAKPKLNDNILVPICTGFMLSIGGIY